jgi:taurine dioxygenase
MIINPLRPFGAEFIGFDCASPEFDHAALAHHIARARVAIFRDQSCDDAAFTQFLSGFGPLVFTEGETPVSGSPLLNLVTNAGRTTAPVSNFHTDSSYFTMPPSFTALRPVILPLQGGATLFSDQVKAADRLAPRIKACLAGRQVLHRCSGLLGIDDETWHPLFRRHPLTNETALYLSTPARCVAIEGMDQPLSARVIAMLYRRSQAAASLYRHIWRAGDLLIWDNRLTMHRADHSGVIGTRTLHRGMVAGETPIPAKP